MKMIDVVVFLIAIAQISADSDVASLLKKRYNSPKATGTKYIYNLWRLLINMIVSSHIRTFWDTSQY